VWTHDKFETKGGLGKRIKASQAAIEAGTKILVENLDYTINDDELGTLFKQVGPIINAEVDYDPSDRSNGKATVTFNKRGDAIAAVQRFNGTELNGKKIELSILEEEQKPVLKRRRPLVGLAAAAAAPSTTANSLVISAGRGGRTVRSGGNGVSFRPRGGGRGRGRGRGRGKW